MAGGYPCADCNQSFPTKLGLSQHRRRAHVAGYQADVAAEDVRKMVTELEMRKVAGEETNIPTHTFMNQYLATRFNSNPVAIKNLRRTQKYRNVCERIVAKRRGRAGSPLPRFPPYLNPPASPLSRCIRSMRMAGILVERQ